MKKIRTIVAGLGGRGSWAASRLDGSDDYDLVGLIDPVEPRARLLVKEAKLSEAEVFTDVRSCLGALDFDALTVFTPDGTHGNLVVPALEAGKHVFVEKPLEISHEKLDAIIDADRKAGGRTMVGFNLRFAPVYRKIHELVAAGVVGRVLTIQADEFYNGGRTYFRRWNRLRKWGGGLWITKACHDFDLLYWLVGADPTCIYANSSLDYYRPRDDAARHCRDCDLLGDCPDRYEPAADPKLLEDPKSRVDRLRQVHEQVTGERPDLCLFNSDKDTFDHGIATITFAGGTLATYTVNVVAGFSDRRMRVSGTRAVIDGNLAGSQLLIRHRDPSREEKIELASGKGGHGGGDRSLFDSFAAFVRGEPTTFVGPEEAAVAVRMGLAARVSCDEKRVVQFGPDAGR